MKESEMVLDEREKAFADEYIISKGNAYETVASAEELMQYLTSVVRGEDTEETLVMKGVGVGMTEANQLEN